MKKQTRFLAFVLAVFMILPALYIPTFAETEEAIPEYGDYYYHYDFENYESGGFTSFDAYFHSTTVTTKGGLICNPLGDTKFNSTPQGDSEIITDETGNQYLRHTFNESTGGARIGAFNIGEKMLCNAVAFDFKFRANGTAADTTKIYLLELRRGGSTSGTIKPILQTDGLGRIYASNLDINVNSTTPIYTPAPGEFMEISVRWYDATNTVSVYINGNSVIENARITLDYRVKTYVSKTWSDSFLAEDYSLVDSTVGTVQFLNVRTALNWSIDIDDIKMYQIATPEGLPYYYQNTFEGFDSLTEGKTISDSAVNNGTYESAYGNKNIKKATEGDNSYVTILSGVVNNADLGFSDGFGIRDREYQTLSSSSWVLEFDIKNTTHNDEGTLRQIITYEDGGLGNVYNGLYLDKDGNLYMSNNTADRIAGVNISGDEWTHIAVVCVNDMSNADMFESFSSSTTAKNSAVKLRRTFAFYIDGKYVGSSDSKDVYTWNTVTGNRTLNGYDISSITNHTETLSTSGLTVVDSTTTANHTIYKSADGLTYYDVEYTDSTKKTQKAYSKMTLTATSVGERGEYLGLFYYNKSTIKASLDNIKIYRGNYPIFMTENAVKEQDGTLLDIDFGSYRFLNGTKTVSSNGGSSVSGLAYGIERSNTNFTSLITKYDANDDGNTDYVNMNMSNGRYEFFFPYSATGVYSFEHTLKNVVPDDIGKYVGFFAIRRENATGYTTSQPLVKAQKNEDGSVQLYTHYNDTNKGRPLYYKNGDPALIDNENWKTIKVIYDESFKNDPSNTLISFYLDGQLLYLDKEGKVPAENIKNTFGNIKNRRYTPNQRLMFCYGDLSDGKLDLKSLTIKSVGEKKNEMKELEADITLKNRITVIESAISFTPYSASANSYYPLVELARTDSNTTRVLGLLYTEANDGLLYIKSTDGDYVVLRDENENAIEISTDAENPTTIAIVYDDVTGLARYYVDGYVPYFGTEKTSASNVQVPDLDFYRMSAKSEGIVLLKETADGFAVNLTASAYNTNYSGTSEIVGIQEGESTNDIRLLAGIDSPYYSTAGFEFEAYINGVSQGIKTVDNPAIYASIKAGNDTVTASEAYGYNYFSVVSITGIPYGVAQNSYVMARPYTVVGGVKSYGESAKIMLSDKGHYFDEAYKATVVSENKELFECSEIESYEGNGLAFNNQGAIFNFNANCSGKVYISLDSSRGLASVDESVFELTVDGKTSEIRLPIGRNHILLAEVEDGDHAFSLKKISGGDFVRINSVTLDGEYTEPALTAVENGVIVKVSEPTSGKDYGDVTVYVQTTDESGKYYVEYPFLCQKNTSVNPYEGDWSISDSANKQYNVNMYRINKGYVAEKNGDSFTRLYQVLQNGEIGVALRETGVQDDGITEYKQAGDAIGGFHGDENIIEAPLFTLDGATVELGASGTYTGTTLEFVQDSIIDRCNNTGENIAKHSQIYKIDTNGIRVKRSLEFLTSDFVAMKGRTYLQMFTFVRQDVMQMDKNAGTVNYNAADLSNTVRLLDAAGEVLHTVDTKNFKVTHADGSVTAFPEDSVTNGVIVKEYKLHGNDVDNRYAEYIGDNNNGIYAKVGFNIVDASTKVDSACISVRKSIFDPAQVDPENTALTSGSHGDNKWYPSFTSVNDPYICQDTVGADSSTNDKVYIPHKGETWSADMIYYIDYNPAN